MGQIVNRIAAAIAKASPRQILVAALALAAVLAFFANSLSPVHASAQKPVALPQPTAALGPPQSLSAAIAAPCDSPGADAIRVATTRATALLQRQQSELMQIFSTLSNR